MSVQLRGPLEAADFAVLAASVDPYIREHGHLEGLLIEAEGVPHYRSFGALKAHLRFVKDHKKKIDRVAVVTESLAMAALPKVANRILEPEIRPFDATHRDEAVHWLKYGRVR